MSSSASGPRSGTAVQDVVLGVDIGTTATKVVAFDTTGAARATASESYPLNSPEPGAAEQDPRQITDAVRTAVRSVVADLGGLHVAGLSFSAAMHGLVGLGADGHPLTPSFTWADTRAFTQADRLREAGEALRLQQRTGTPVHPMSPMVKLMWLHETRPELTASVRHWAGVKELLLRHWCGELVSDVSIASATGLLALETLDWDDEVLALAGVTRHQLPAVVPTTRVVGGLTADAATELGLPAGTKVVVGASDGPLANLGLGAVHPGQTACSIGTSAALRVITDRPIVDQHGGLFCYAFRPGRWVVGGALNNGGVVLAWARDALAPDLVDRAGERAGQRAGEALSELTELAAKAPPGSGGLLMLPYLLGERAPHWSSLPRGAYVGLTREHRREHLVRSALEGVCLQLGLVYDSMLSAGIDVRDLRATGGFARSPFWRQLLGDVLGMPVHFPQGHEGSAFGAALLGMEALGLVPSMDVAADLVTVAETVEPDPATAELYARLRPLFGSLYGMLEPAYRQLRDLADVLDVPAASPPSS